MGWQLHLGQLDGLRRSTLDADQRLALGESLRLPGARFNGALGRPAMLYAVSRRSRHPELAVRLLNYLLTDAAAARTLAVVRGLPSAKRALDVVLRERLAGDLETQAWQQVNAERAAGRIARPAPAFEDARMRKFLRDSSVWPTAGSPTRRRPSSCGCTATRC